MLCNDLMNMVINEASNPEDRIASFGALVFGHMLKYQYQPFKQSASWIEIIVKKGIPEIQRCLSVKKGLRKRITSSDLDKWYNDGLKNIAIPETKGYNINFPEQRPEDWTLDNILDYEFIKNFLVSNAQTIYAKNYLEKYI